MRMFILGSGEYEIGNLAFASKIINFLYTKHNFSLITILGNIKKKMFCKKIVPKIVQSEKISFKKIIFSDATAIISSFLSSLTQYKPSINHSDLILI